MNNIISQDFWCVTLTKDNRECSWPEASILEDDITHHLMIEQAVLGLNTKDTCMIEATSMSAAGAKKSSMICQLIPKNVPNCHLTLSFKQVKLRLASGDGPVYLTGTHSQEIDETEDGSEEGLDIPELVDGEVKMDEESSEDDQDFGEETMMEELAAAQANKLKEFMKKNKKGKAKAAPASKKVEELLPEKIVEEVVESDDDDEESDDNEEESDADEEESDADADDGKVDANNEVDANDEESDEDDEESDDDEEEEEDEDESEEEPVMPVSKKRKTEKPNVPVNGEATSTPLPKKKPQTPTPKPNINELKKKLLASPNLPKKYEKFANLMKNAHKITDEKEIKTTWAFLQKSKK